MRTTVRVLTTLIGVFFFLQGVAWLIAPERAAAGLAMPVLDGLARSTQFGDFAAFFLVLGASILIGSRDGSERVLSFPVAMLGSAAFCRTLAWAVHGAQFAALFIFVELGASALLLARTRLSDGR